MKQKERTEDCGFPGIVEAEHEDSSLSVAEQRGEQPSEYDTHRESTSLFRS